MVVQARSAWPEPVELPIADLDAPWDEAAAEVASNASPPTANHEPPATPTVADILRRYGPDYLMMHDVTAQQSKVLTELMQCRTPILGGEAWMCGDCGHKHVRYHSCRNRHCPTCGGPAKGRWYHRMLEWKLPVQYVHIVFTVPHELLPVIWANQKRLYELLFHAAWKSLSKYVRKRLRIQLGAAMVLHSWGQTMNRHVHAHCVVPLGGLALDGTQWIDGQDVATFFGTDDLANRFRDTFLRGLRRLHRRDELNWPAGSNCPLPTADGPLSSKTWIVHCQNPPKNLQDSPESAIRYLARYVTGTAISNGRVLADDGQNVTIAVKDYRNGGQYIRDTISGEEFVGRFITHILPRGLIRVRYYGILTNQTRNTNLDQCRRLLGVADDAGDEEEDSASNTEDRFDGEERENDPPAPRCRKCGAPEMEFQYDIPPKVRWHLYRYGNMFIPQMMSRRRPTTRPP